MQLAGNPGILASRDTRRISDRPYAVYAWRRMESTLRKSMTTANAPSTASSNRILPRPPGNSARLTVP